MPWQWRPTFPAVCLPFPSWACRIPLCVKAPTVCAPPSKIWASSSRTGALPSILPRRMCARPARCTTCRFCWQCSLPAASWRMCLPTRHFWANWHWTAPCGRFPACCPWRWLQQKMAPTPCMYLPRMPPKQPRPVPTAWPSTPPTRHAKL